MKTIIVVLTLAIVLPVSMLMAQAIQPQPQAVETVAAPGVYVNVPGFVRVFTQPVYSAPVVAGGVYVTAPGVSVAVPMVRPRYYMRPVYAPVAPVRRARVLYVW